MLRQLRQLIPVGITVSLVGDGEFGNTRVLTLLDAWHWVCILHQTKNTKILLTDTTVWQRLDNLPLQRGQIRIWHKVRLTDKVYLITLVAVWRASEKEPVLTKPRLKQVGGFTKGVCGLRKCLAI